MKLRHAVSCRLFVCLTVAGGLIVGGAQTTTAAKPRRPPTRAAAWQIVETENFRILNYGCKPAEDAIGVACEKLRAQLAAQWLAKAPDKWQPKCDVVLHPSDTSYDREVGAGGRNTVASALVDRRQQAVSIRRIDVRATRADWQRLALAHELTHVVLAERFDPQELPRWLDEGIAILADSASKRKQHAWRAGQVVAQGTHFRLAELLLLEGYPPAQRWGTFYDQSASLVEFLVAEQGPQRLLEFVELAVDRGYDHAFVQIYAMPPADVERRWHRSFNAAAPPDQSAASELAAWKIADMGG